MKIWKRVRHWLFRRFLPAWCREELLSENATLRERLADARQQNERLSAYIDGMEAALRRQGRVTIYTGEVRDNGNPVSPAQQREDL